MRSRMIAVALFAGMLAGPATAQEPDWAKIEMKAQPVAGRIHMLYGVGGFAGGNIGVSVGDDGVVLVDDGYEPLVPKIEAALKTVTAAPVRFILNTHFHGDHVHGNKVFGTRGVVVAHDNARRRMEKRDDFDGQPGTRAPRHALPVITFDRHLTLHVNDEEVRGIHAPAGHTDGDVVVFFTASKVVHMGDLLFNGMFPFIDLENGGSVKGMIAAVDQVLEEVPDDVKIVPGHGPLATKEDLSAYGAMLKDCVALVQRGIDGGKTVEQIQKEKPLAAYDARWGGGFVGSDAFVAQLYNGLKGIAKNPPR
jgi:cyclase